MHHATQSGHLGNVVVIEKQSLVARRLRLHKDVRITAVVTPRLVDPIEGGVAYVYFFPQGHSEPAIIHLADNGGKYYSVVLHPLSGRARVHPCRYNVPDEFGVSDDEKRPSKQEICVEDAPP